MFLFILEIRLYEIVVPHAKVKTLKNIINFMSYSFIFFRACYGVLRFVMENGAKGCEVRDIVLQNLVISAFSGLPDLISNLFMPTYR